MCWGLVVLAVAVVALPWVRTMFREEPWYYRALRCRRENEEPGERRFWVRLMFKPALIVQTAGPDGAVVGLAAVPAGDDSIRRDDEETKQKP
jgi:hypothetical protein